MSVALGEIVRFALVGVANTGVDMGLYAVLVLAAGVPPVLANVLSYSAGILCSFVLNSRWTFRATRRSAAQSLPAFALFGSAAAAGLALSTLIVAVLEGIAGPIAAKAVSVPLVFGWSFLSARHILKAPARAGRQRAA